MQAHRGQPIPEWFDEEPPIHDSSRFFLEAFDRLNTCRPIGFDIGPIPWTAIEHYARSRGLDREMTRLLHAVIIRLDRDWVAEVKRRRKRSEG